MATKRGRPFIGYDEYAGVIRFDCDDDDLAHIARLMKRDWRKARRKGRLTDHQIQVMDLLLKGWRVCEVAAILDIEEPTVCQRRECALARIRKVQGIGLFTVLCEELGKPAMAQYLGQSRWFADVAKLRSEGLLDNQRY